MVTHDKVYDALGRCFDPCCRERGISVVDMGLIESVHIAGSQVQVDMVLTSGWCPSVSNLHQMITDEVALIEGVDKVDVEVVFDPVWSMDRLSESARSKLEMDLTPLLPYREQRVRMEVQR